MSGRRRIAPPSTPQSILRRRALERGDTARPEEWGVDSKSLRLPANSDVDARLGAGGKVVRARRQDVFDLLVARGRLAPDTLGAVRRLQQDMAVLHRTLSGVRDFSPRVDVGRDPQSFSDSRLHAGERIAAVLELSGAASARLLSALCEAAVVEGRADDWRAVVERETGERLADAQGAALRAACENLAGAYRLFDGRRRRSDDRASAQ
ncbi:MAG TPA: hypothetical protein VGH03_14020 [Caulobacteraceae bacterium]|jgi:hypothetical protein